MASNDLKQIRELIDDLTKHSPVGSEYNEAIERIGGTGDPLALPTLKRALKAASSYKKWTDNLSRKTSDDFKKNEPGGWIVEAMPMLSDELITNLRTACEKCASQKKWWQVWK